MSDKTLHVITGLPRSGGSMIASVLAQNPKFHSNTNSFLPVLLNLLSKNYHALANGQKDSQHIKNILTAVIQGFYAHTDAPVIFDRHLMWPTLLPMLESVLDRPVKVLVCVRNPAEIITSFERSRVDNPLAIGVADQNLGEQSSIASRAMYYSGPEGILGITHRNLHDAVIKGYLDRMLFVDYGLYCGSPRSQTQRIYDFFDLDEFDHDFNNLDSEIHDVRSKVQKVTVNCVQYIGLDLFEQYNTNTFWNAWV